jgi:hypothetical protein
MEAVERVADAKLRHPLVTLEGLKHTIANLTLAASFFVAALPAANQRPNNLANTIWIVGAIIIGVFR